jgi:hypothetical protein
MYEPWRAASRFARDAPASDEDVPERACESRPLVVPERPPFNPACLEAPLHLDPYRRPRPPGRLLEADQRDTEAASRQA